MQGTIDNVYVCGAWELPSLHMFTRFSTYSKSAYGFCIRTLGSVPRSLPTTDAQKNTIYALSTPPGKGGIAVVRVSGPAVLDVWKQMVRPSRSRFIVRPLPWRMERCRIVKPTTLEESLDSGLAVFFKGISTDFFKGKKLDSYINVLNRSTIFHNRGCPRITHPLRTRCHRVCSLCFIFHSVLSAG